MNKFLENKYPYLSNFFTTAIGQGRLFHSIILYGNNNYIQYAMALELARKLNCIKDRSKDCDCQNCRWIRENKHPAVMTISKIDNKNDSSSTVIGEEQINTILDNLVNSSNYHRVFIFCDAEIKQLSNEEKLQFDEFTSTGFNLPQEVTDKGIWYPSGIDKTKISDTAANSMLKTLEEPNENATFIFLTKNKDDLISTVVSRSQSFYMPDSNKQEYNVDFIKKAFTNYPNIKKENAVAFAEYLYNYQCENNLKPINVIDSIQFYLTQLAKSNIDNKVLLTKIFNDINKTQESKKMLNSFMKEQSVFEDLAFYFANR